MIKNEYDTITYVINSIVDKFGYDVSSYFPENRNEYPHTSDYIDFIHKLSAETFKWRLKSNDEQIILIRGGVSYQGKNEFYDEAFRLKLNFGSVKTGKLYDVIDNFNKTGNVLKKGCMIKTLFNEKIFITHDMLPDYKKHCRDVKIEGLLK